MPARLILTMLGAMAAVLGCAAFATANTSHEGWPVIDGVLKMHKTDADGPLRGVRDRHNELLGGHGDDTLYAGDAGDVLWGDYKPSGQPSSQVDEFHGGPGKDFIYAGHGTNRIDTGGGPDVVHAHFGRGTIRCGSASVTVFLSHRSRPRYHLHGCRHISYKTAGY